MHVREWMCIYLFFRWPALGKWSFDRSWKESLVKSAPFQARKGCLRGPKNYPVKKIRGDKTNMGILGGTKI